jgi:hypothetical protein
LKNLFVKERFSNGKAVIDACIISLLSFKVALQIVELFGIE